MDDDEYGPCVPSRPMRRIDVAVIAATMLRDIASDVAQAFDLLADVVMGHANHQVDRDTFRMEAALEIERLTEGE